MLFDVHITEISKNISGTLMYINHMQDSLSKDARIIAIQTASLSHIDYAMTVRSTCSITQLRRKALKFDHATFQFKRNVFFFIIVL